MSATADTPSRVAVETPRGSIRSADVIDEEWIATATHKGWRYTVELDGCHLIYPAEEVEPVR